MSYLEQHKTFHISQLLLQVFFVGIMLGIFRTVIPALSESEFGVPENAFFLLANFIVVFGFIKSIFNFLSSRFSDLFGRKRILVIGWLFGLAVPWVIAYTSGWWGVIGATFLLGINQGLCWSMSQIMKIDLIERRYHGLALGMNETLGYCGVAIAGYFSAWLTIQWGVNEAILWMGTLTAAIALFDSLIFCGETLPAIAKQRQRSSTGEIEKKTTHLEKKLFIEVSFRNTSTMALCLAGLVEKFVDVLIWLIYPVFLYRQGVDLLSIALITGTYAGSWGIIQLFTGSASDKFGRRPFIIYGMLLCAIGCTLTLLSFEKEWWILNALIIGIGMAMLYPTLGAAMSDHMSEKQRGTVMGIYRFWRDSGYFFGALLFALVATIGQNMIPVFIVTSLCLVASALFVAVAVKQKQHQIF